MSGYLGPYRILRLVDRGGQAAVYLGYDERLRRRVAIKVYTLPDDRKARRRLLREARLVAGLESPRIVPVHDVIESREYLAMVMEYVPGCTLSELMSHEQLAMPSAMIVGIDIASALSVARRHKVVHADVKPENILVGRSGRCKLVDFGIARPAALPGIITGSLSTLAPEHCAGAPATEQSDLFALGLLIYRMLCGVHPFARNGRVDKTLLSSGQFTPLHEAVPAHIELPPELSGLVGELLHADPGQRPRNTRAIRQVMREALRSLPIAAQNSLLHEARPYFREESAQDIPVQLPEELVREGRSRLALAQGGILGGLAVLRQLRTRARWLLAGSVLVAALLLGAGIAHFDAVILRMDPPQFVVAENTPMPVRLTRDWLMQEIESALPQHLDRIQRARDLDAAQTSRLRSYHRTVMESLFGGYTVDQRIATTLRCLEGFCVVSLVRKTGRAQHSAQGILFADESPAQWRGTVRAAVAGLFP